MDEIYTSLKWAYFLKFASVYQYVHLKKNYMICVLTL